MKSYFSTDFKLGILGGGQLGRMLLTETLKYDVNTRVLDSSTDAPCSKFCNEFVQGSLMDYETVYQFGKTVDVLTIEIEHVNIDALEQLEKEGVIVYPQANVLKIIQNKGDQKNFYTKHNIPTAPYKRYKSLKELESNVDKLPFIWKSTQFGYDGKGVKVIKSIEDLNNLSQGECITEEIIPFKNELAIIVARNSYGQTKTYPVVEMEFNNLANQVEYVMCPARVPDKIKDKSKALALKTSNAFKHIGLLAIEMFQTQDDQIIVNEVAPRTHNSGHYSIEASYTNQFEQHIRSILSLPLGSTDSKIASVMINLVGAKGFKGNVYYENIEKVLALEGVTPHIYGKKITKPFRKMGHVTIVNKDINKAREIADKVKKCIRVIAK